MAHGDAREGKWRGNWRMEWVASTLHTTSEHDVSSITTADAHTSAASSRLNWRPRRFKWTRPFRRKRKSGFCACAITFQTQSTCLPMFWDSLSVPNSRVKAAPRNVGKELPTNAAIKPRPQEHSDGRIKSRKWNLRCYGRSLDLTGTYRLLASSSTNKRITSVSKVHSEKACLNENYCLQQLYTYRKAKYVIAYLIAPL